MQFVTVRRKVGSERYPQAIRTSRRGTVLVSFLSIHPSLTSSFLQNPFNNIARRVILWISRDPHCAAVGEYFIAFGNGLLSVICALRVYRGLQEFQDTR